MALSSGTRNVLVEGAGWVLLTVACAASVIFFEDLKWGVAELIGFPPAAETAAVHQITEANGVERRSGAVVEIPSGQGGHFHADAEINGRAIAFLVDTGATLVALSYEDAERAGIYLKPSDFTHGVTTANGTARIAPVELDRVSIGDITVRHVAAAVSEPGRLKTSLLGMSFLGRLSRFDMRDGVLLLQD